MNTHARIARIESVGAKRSNVWAIVLAGGEGVQLRALTRHLYGEDRPKQYAVLMGTRSLLWQTLDRVALAVPTERTVVVTLASHDRFLPAALDGGGLPHVLAQPQDCGTAAGVLLPAHWIAARDPRATVVVFPSDHFIHEEAAFMAHVGAVATFVRQHPDRMVVLGAQPTEPETEYGWIEPGERMGWTARGPVYRIRRFQRKPSTETARTLLAVGCLWNTSVLVAAVSALVDAGREGVPGLHHRLSRAAAFTGTEHEDGAIRLAYEVAPRVSFFRSVLEPSSRSLAVAKLTGVTWCDLGTPSRVVRALAGQSMPSPGVAALRHLAWVSLAG
jgi:mannose-1-phosphate guanylyltransferase